jgi:hypothetical protein
MWEHKQAYTLIFHFFGQLTYDILSYKQTIELSFLKSTHQINVFGEDELLVVSVVSDDKSESNPNSWKLQQLFKPKEYIFTVVINYLL